MKLVPNTNPPAPVAFRPFDFTLRIETEADALRLRAIFNHNRVADFLVRDGITDSSIRNFLDREIRTQGGYVDGELNSLAAKVHAELCNVLRGCP